MRYLCLIYDEETKLAGMSKSDSDAFMGEYDLSTREGLRDLEGAREYGASLRAYAQPLTGLEPSNRREVTVRGLPTHGVVKARSEAECAAQDRILFGSWEAPGADREQAPEARARPHAPAVSGRVPHGSR